MAIPSSRESTTMSLDKFSIRHVPSPVDPVHTPWSEIHIKNIRDHIFRLKEASSIGFAPTLSVFYCSNCNGYKDNVTKYGVFCHCRINPVMWVIQMIINEHAQGRTLFKRIS